MKDSTTIGIALLFFVYLDVAMAYEPLAHSAISDAAVESAKVYQNREVFENLGFERARQYTNEYSQRGRTLKELVGLGSILEDGLDQGWLSGCRGIANPRVQHHFYDPVRDKGLNSLVIEGSKSPDWALVGKEGSNEQVFSLANGRDYLYNSLTSLAPSVRDIETANTFQTLGHVIHHIQDMAQPQHVRNDVHLTFEDCIGNIEFWLEHRSLTEKYTEKLWENDLLSAVLSAKLFSDKPVHFDRARQFWVTDEATGGTGQGIAEFTNNNFVSEGTNFRIYNGQVAVNAEYTLPRPEGPADSQFQIPTRVEELLPPDERCGTNHLGLSYCLHGVLEFYKTTVTDKYLRSSGATNNRASTLALWDYDLRSYRGVVQYFIGNLYEDVTDVILVDRLFTITRFNIEAALKFLMPRAVAYGAGLIDHFFRARLKSKLSKQSDGSSIEIRNTGRDPLRGNFELYYNDVDNYRYLLDSKTNESLYPEDQAITPTGLNPTSLTFHVATRPSDLNLDEPYVVVFQGDTVFKSPDSGAQQYEPAVTGFVIDNRKIVFAKPSGDTRKMNPETGNARDYYGGFGGSSRIKKHPTNDDLALVFHPFRKTVHVINYDTSESVPIKVEPLSDYWQVATRWLGDRVMVATIGVIGGISGFQTRYQYKIFSLTEDHQLELVDTNTFSSDNVDFGATGGVRSWGHWVGQSEYFDLAYGPYANWYSFDILPDGTMITLLGRWRDAANTSESRTYYTVPNCTDQPLESEITSHSAQHVDMKLQKVRLNGVIENENRSAFHNFQGTNESYYAPPQAPQEPGVCGTGSLVKEVSTVQRNWRYLLHLDVKPDGQISEVVENGNLGGQRVWTITDGATSDFTGSKTYTIDGQQFDGGNYVARQNQSENIEEEDGIEFWDLQYDENGKPYALWVKEHLWFDGTSTYNHDTSLNFGSPGNKVELLTNRHNYYEFGPPLEVADVVVDPYRQAALAVVKVRDSSFYAPYDYTVDTTEFIRYQGKSNVDLRQKYEQELAGVTNLQFIP